MGWRKMNTNASSQNQTLLVSYRNPLALLNHEKIIPIDRTTVFGNPFPITSIQDRAAVIESYRMWFENKMFTDWHFRYSVEQLKGKVLGCWCTPLPCHGDIIIEYLEGDTTWAKNIKNTG